jgi:hypothetical protein
MKMEHLLNDLRYGARMLMKKPGFTLIAVLALSLSDGKPETFRSWIGTQGFSAQPGPQNQQKPDVWQPLKFLVGAWEGTSKGEPGAGRVEREYRFALNGAFLEVRNKSAYPAQEKNPQGEVHEDRGFISFDKLRRKFVLRQFHLEGFVNQYALTNISADGRTLVFETESIENIPAGWRARETYKLIGNDEFVEVFELAAPGKGFAVYSESALKRKQSAGK